MRFRNMSCSALPVALSFGLSFFPVASLAQTAAPTPSQYEVQRSAATGEDQMPPAPPEDQTEAVRLSDAEGQIRLVDSTGSPIGQAQLNALVAPGMRLETGNDGRGELEFADGSVARLTPNSELDVVSITRDEAEHTRVRLKAAKGLTYYELAPSSSTFLVEIGSLVAARGSSPANAAQKALLRVSLDATPFEAAVLRGDIHFEDPAQIASFDLEANQTARIDPASATNYDTAQEITPDSWDGWNTDREAVLAQIASARSGGDEPEGAGWNDLDYYGSWYNIPGQGPAWAPDGVDQSFDPYGSGAWSYSVGLGYTWASAYPWGWLPYHCGLWTYYNSYGWMWLPANCGWGYGGGWYPYSEARGLDGYKLPLRPLPARGITHVTPSQPVIVMRRGTPVRFRGIGEPRPAGRPVVLAGQTLQPAPVEARQRYRPLGGGGAAQNSLRTSQGSGGGRPPFQTGSGMRAPSDGRMNSVIVPRFTPAPSAAPAPRVSAPAPASPPPASHVASPAAAPSPSGGHH